jgi:hypothetical protein
MLVAGIVVLAKFPKEEGFVRLLALIAELDPCPCLRLLSRMPPMVLILE